MLSQLNFKNVTSVCVMDNKEQHYQRTDYLNDKIDLNFSNEGPIRFPDEEPSLETSYCILSPR